MHYYCLKYVLINCLFSTNSVHGWMMVEFVMNRDLEQYGSSPGAIFARSEVLVIDYRSIAWKYASSWCVPLAATVAQASRK
jgi:hypothetical protein